MEITAKKNIRINLISLIFIGSGSIFILIFSIYLLLLNIYGRFELLDIIDSVKRMDFFQSDSNYSAAILLSEYSKSLLNDESNWYENNIKTWQKFAESSGIILDVIGDETIENGDFKKYNLIILSSAKALSNTEIIRIKQYLENGGNIFATNSTATFDREGKWRGWKFFNEVFGIKFINEFSSIEKTRKQTFRGNIPITAGIPSGFSLRIATWDNPMACKVLEPRTQPISFWNNFRSDNHFVTENTEEMAGSVFGNYGKGRFVWMGFDINSVHGEQEEYIMFDKFFNNIISWLNKKPIIFVKDWPGNYKAASVINVNVNSDLSNKDNILKYIDKESLPMTFYIDSEIAKQNVLQVKMLSQNGELGALVPLGNLVSANNIVYHLDDYNKQYEQLKNSKAILEKIIERPINNAMPLYGMYDENTVHALIAAGYKTLVSDSLFNKSVPNSLIKGNKQIITFNKTAYTSSEINSNFGINNLEYQLSTYKDDIDRVIFEGGLYNLNIQSNILSTNDYSVILNDLFKYLKSKNIWLAKSDEIRNWWIAKNSIEVGINEISKRRISFLITNPSDFVINDLIIQIDINKSIKNLEITSEIIGTKIPDFVFDKDNKRIHLKLKDLKAGESNSYFIDFDELAI